MKIGIKNYSWCTVSILASNFACGMEYYEYPQANYPNVKLQGSTEKMYAYMDSHGATGMYGPQEIPYLSGVGIQGPQGFTGMYPQRGIQQGLVYTYSDPVVQYYTPQIVKISADRLIKHLESNGTTEELYKFNYLDFSNYNFSTSTLHNLIDQTDFSSIRNIDVSCENGEGPTFNSNEFLFKLFSKNSTLRSVTHIDARGSNIKDVTLELLRDKTDFDGPLIRDMWKISERTSKKVASIEVQVSGTPIEKLGIEEQKKLQVPAQKQLSILYRYDKYLPGSVAHLQIQLIR